MKENYITILEITKNIEQKKIKIDNNDIYIELINHIYTLNDETLIFLDLYNFNIINENQWEYDGYINFETKKSVIKIINKKHKSKIEIDKSYLYEHFFKNNYDLQFVNKKGKSTSPKIKNKRNRDFFFNIGYDKYNLPYYINLSKKNYENKIYKDIKNKNLINKDIKSNIYIIDKHIDLIPIYFKNESLFLIKDNEYLFEDIIQKIYRQENNFIILSKDLHALIEINHIILNNLEFFNYYSNDCVIEAGVKDQIFYGKESPINKNLLNLLQENIEQIGSVFSWDEKKITKINNNIIIPTEKNNETMFAHNIRIIVEDIIKDVLNNDKLKKKRDEIPDYKRKEKDKEEVMNKYLALLCKKEKYYFDTLLNPLINFRNMYSHNSTASYINNYNKNYKFVEKGCPNKYQLKKDSKLNNYNFMSKKAIEDLNTFLNNIITLFN